MLQVSLSAYNQHRSKAQNLKDTVVSPESIHNPGANWIEYYTALANSAITPATPMSHAPETTSAVTPTTPMSRPPLKRVYVYISPKELLKNESTETPYTILHEQGTCSRTRDFCLGLVKAGTSTAEEITRIMCNLNIT